jgi:hypothetical protein
MKQLLPLMMLIVLAGCKGKPSEKDIKKKILLDYVCAETAKVNNMQILSTKDAVAIFGNKGYEYEVSGEVEWTDGCREYGTRLDPGFTEKFEHKRVFLIKGNDGVWR